MFLFNGLKIFRSIRVVFSLGLGIFYATLSQGGQIVDFYEDRGQNPSGHSYSQVMRYSDDELEAHHDFVQFLFPTKQQSKYAKGSTPITDIEISIFKTNLTLMNKFKQALVRMSSFYGLKFDEKTNSFSYANGYQNRFKEWVQSGNHNFLRLTRILTCLNLMDMSKEAGSLFQCLSNIYDYGQNSNIIGKETYKFWASAALPR